MMNWRRVHLLETMLSPAWATQVDHDGAKLFSERVDLGPKFSLRFALLCFALRPAGLIDRPNWPTVIDLSALRWLAAADR